MGDCSVRVRAPRIYARAFSTAISVIAGRRALSILAFSGAVMTIGALWHCPSLVAQTLDSASGEEPNSSWTATTDSSSKDGNSRRLLEKHTQEGDRALDTKSAELRQFDGRFEPYQDIETETLQSDANTVRTVTRRFGRDGNGEKILVQVDEEGKHILPSGDSSVRHVTSTPDVSGSVRPSRQEFSETKLVGEGAEETETTIMFPSINGGPVAAEKIHESRTGVGTGTVQSQATTLLLDGSGNWGVSETRQSVTNQQGKNRSLEEHISRPNSEGKLVEVSKILIKESEKTSGEKFKVVETYSVDVPGKIRDGTLHLVERTTSTEQLSLSGERTIEQKLEQTNPGDPASDLRVSVLVDSRTVPELSGEQSTVTVRSRDSNGGFGIVSVDTTKSDKLPSFQIEPKPSEHSK